MTNDINIEVGNNERFRQQVEDGTNDPFTILDIYVGGEHVKGGNSYVTRTLVETLEAVERILNNEKEVVVYSGGPSYLVFEPHDEKTVSVTGCGTLEAAENPEERLSIDKTVVVDKKSWVLELIHTAEEYHKRVLGINPNLEDTKSLRRLRDAISDTKEYLDVHENK